MNEENQVYFVDSDTLPPAALERKHRLEQDPSFRTDHMEYMKGMEIIQSDIKDKVLKAMDEFDYDAYTAADVERALSHETCSVEDFKALISPAAAPYLEQMARKAEEVTKNHFGNTVYIFTPLYIANYCQNYCIYCGFNCYNNIRRKKLTFEEIEHEMQVIAKTGMEEILILTGESRAYSDVTYIGEAVKIARKYFKNIGIEIYPVNVDEYRYLHECGVDYVTVFQETYNTDKYETLHLMGHKRVWPYRFDAQERALMGGMRGAGFSALLGLDDFRKDALATALHVYYINRKYPHAELSLSCPRLRPIVNNDKINPRDVGENSVRCCVHIGCSCPLQESRCPAGRAKASEMELRRSVLRKSPQAFLPELVITKKNTKEKKMQMWETSSLRSMTTAPLIKCIRIWSGAVCSRS